MTAGLRTALYAGHLLRPLAGRHLRKRLARGKEDPARLPEKRAAAQAARPEGRLVWLHGVGLGEALALRGLIDALADRQPDLRFLVTYGTTSASTAIARNLPARCQHQFLPLDLPGIAERFLDHWQPDLAVWTDQEIWPRLAWLLHRRAIPQAVVAGRISPTSAQARGRFASFYRGLYSLPDLIEAQDAHTARIIADLTGRQVAVTGSLKPAAAPLAPAADHAGLATRLADRDIWLLASSHPADEAVALQAQTQLARHDERALLIIAPRDPDRGREIVAAARQSGLAAHTRDTLPDARTQVWVADSFGELGSWYRLARATLIGGTFDNTQGHNPWEAAALGTAILHGPHTANFATDYTRLTTAGAATAVASAQDLAAALAGPDLARLAEAAARTRTTAAAGVGDMAARLTALMEAS